MTSPASHGGGHFTSGNVPEESPSRSAAAPNSREHWGSSLMVRAGFVGRMVAMGSLWTIRRSAADAKLTGLCGGVARHWGIDPVLVRVGALLLALSGGIGVVLYLAGWLLVPADNRRTSILYDVAGPTVRRWPKEAWVVIVVVACFVVFAAFGFATPFGVTPAVVLALLWYFGYYKNRSRQSRGGSHPSNPQPPGSIDPSVPPITTPTDFRYPGPATPFTEAADSWRQRMAEVSRPAGPSFPLYAEAPATTDPRLSDPEAVERAAFLANPDPAGLYSEPAATVATDPGRVVVARTRSARRLRLIGLVVLGLTLAGLGVADAAGVPVSAAVYVAAALLVIGLTLIAATWFGRARGILPVGLALVVVLASVTGADVHAESDSWSRTASYTSIGSLPRTCDRQELGALTVDLSKLDVTRPATYCALVEGGKLEVLAPAGANVRINYDVGAGVVVENGEPSFSGTELTGSLEPPAGSLNRPTLTLDLSVDVGELRVQR